MIYGRIIPVVIDILVIAVIKERIGLFDKFVLDQIFALLHPLEKSRITLCHGFGKQFLQQLDSLDLSAPAAACGAKGSAVLCRHRRIKQSDAPHCLAV